MLAEKEETFLRHWEKERVKRVSILNRILSGLPMAALFSIPVLLLVFAVYLFFPVWYTRISNSLSSTFMPVVIAVFLTMIFFSYFRMQYKQEMNEQLYQELLNKIKKDKAASSPEFNS